MQGDISTLNRCSDIYYVDTGMYDVSEYGSVYLIDDERPALVDTGTGANHDRILDLLDEVGIARTALEHILITHVHLDHAGGAGYLTEACPNADVYVHERGSRHLVDPSRIIEGTKQAVGEQWRYYGKPKPIPEKRVVEITDGETLDLGDHVLDVHHAPGHAPHQVIFHDQLIDTVFAADAAGAWVPSINTIYTPSPPPNFDLEQVVADIEMIADLSPDALLFAHYGPGPSDVQRLLADYRTAIKEWVTAVEEKNNELDSESDVIEYFVSRTDVREVWGAERAEADIAMNVRGVLRYLEDRDGSETTNG